jgi:hypothetical protein
MKLNKNRIYHFYFWALMGATAIILLQVFFWIQNLPSFFQTCSYCIQFEIQRKIHDFIPSIFEWNVILIPISIIQGVEK